jgi:hypothetical protein
MSQHMDALKLANEIRLGRAKLKQQVGAGTITVADVIADAPDCAGSMTIAELVSSQRRWGTTRTSKLLAGIGMPETKTIGSLTLRQRGLLIGLLGFEGSDAHQRMVRAEEFEREAREARTGLCGRLNGRGPCLRRPDHGGACVRADHAPRLGMVYFRNGITDALLATAEVPIGNPCPAPAELVGLLEVALRPLVGTTA